MSTRVKPWKGSDKNNNEDSYVEPCIASKRGTERTKDTRTPFTRRAVKKEKRVLQLALLHVLPAAKLAPDR